MNLNEKPISEAEAHSDSEYFSSINPKDLIRCSVYECDRPDATEYRVAPQGICDPGEVERWPVVHFCPLHMREIMAKE